MKPERRWTSRLLLRGIRQSGFRSLCFVARRAAALGDYRLRVRQIARTMKARFDERLAERTRIARDLHDTFLQDHPGQQAGCRTMR